LHQEVHTYKEIKMADPKKDKMTSTQEAYAEGIRTGKGKPILRNIDKGISKATLSTTKEKRMMDKGYSDMRKAIEAESKRKEMKKGGAVHTMPDGKKMKGAKHGMKHGGAVKGKKCRMDGIAVRGKTRAKQRSK
jgi:hypothetical protein